MNPPGPLRQVRLLLGLGVRRWLNRLTSGALARRSAKGAGAATVRPPTARRRVGMGALLLVAGLGMLLQVGVSIFGFHARAQAAAEDRPAVQPWLWQSLRREAEAGRPGWETRARSLLSQDPAIRRGEPAERPARLDAAIAALAHGAPGDAERQHQLAVFAGALFALMAVCIVALSLGMGNLDLARPDWDELWLAALPVSSGALFAARLVQYALLNVLAWLLLAPAVATLALLSGAGWTASLALGLAAGAAWAVATGGLRLAAETWLRQRLAHARIKNLQAVLTVVGMATMVALYAVAMGLGPLPGWFTGLARALPWDLLPTGWAAVAALEPARALWLAPAGLAVALAIGFATVRLCAAWSQGGLLAHDGTLAGARGAAPRAWRPLRVLGKDLVLLRRDRALLVQALVMPLFMIALQLALNPELLKSAAGGFTAAATFVAALGGWVLMSGCMALAHEGQALWILAGAPMPLADAIRGKVAMWAGFALCYAVAGLAVVAAVLPWPGAAALGDIAMVLAGMPLLAALAVGLGAAATDPLSTVPNRRVGPAATFTYMMMMGLFSLTLAQGSPHQRLALLALLAAIAWAMWQRLRDRLDWLFEPVDRPPRRVDLADGAWAAFAFLVLQGLCAALLLALDVGAETAVLAAFGLAGAITVPLTLLVLWRARVPSLLRAVGILPDGPARLPRTLALGLTAGAGAAAFAVAYLAIVAWLAPLLPGLGQVLEQAQAAEQHLDWRFAVLAVVLAPLCEEFIFRGLLFRGLRRDLGAWAAAAASAGIFAIIHPSLGVVPVFGLGLACALAYERSRWLLAPVLAHALYNGTVLLLSGG